MTTRSCQNQIRFTMIPVFSFLLFATHTYALTPDALADGFRSPPDSARPGVYWYFMDGNANREGMTADLESMKAAGIGNLIFLEVNVGVPRGPQRSLER